MYLILIWTILIVFAVFMCVIELMYENAVVTEQDKSSGQEESVPKQGPSRVSSL